MYLLETTLLVHLHNIKRAYGKIYMYMYVFMSYLIICDLILQKGPCEIILIKHLPSTARHSTIS